MALTAEQVTAQNFKDFYDRIRPLLDAKHYHIDRSGDELKSCYASLGSAWTATANTNVPFVKRSGEFIQPSTGLFTIPNGTKVEVVYTFGGNPGGDSTFGLYNNTDSLWITADGADLKMIDPFIQSGYNYGSVLQVIWKNETGHDVDVAIRCNGVAQSTTLAVDRNVLTIKEIGRIVDPVQYINNGEDGLEETPVGNIIAYMGNDAPKHYLKCDGNEYPIGSFPELEAHFISEFGSVNYFGGDGTTKFAVPDLRGEFLRGTGSNSHTNQGSGANVGTHQDATAMPSVSAGYDGLYMNNIPASGTNGNENVDGGYKRNGSNRSASVNIAGTWSSSADNMISSRPTNTSVQYCIKYESTYHVIVPSHTYKVHATYSLAWDSTNQHYTNSTLTYLDGDSSLIDGRNFKAPKSGWYAVSFNSNQATKSKQVMQYVHRVHDGNDYQFVDGALSDSRTGYWGVNANKTMYLEEGDTVYFRIWCEGVEIALPGKYWADFCLLTSEYKDNIIGGAEVYSEDEQVIGTWIDGKKLYKKTINCGAGPNNTTKTVATGISNIDTFVSLGGIYKRSDNCQFPIPNVNVTGSSRYDNGVYYINSENKFYIVATWDASGCTTYITATYTKTTDTAGQYQYKNSLLLSRPDLWEENTEIDFGGGLYGKRIVSSSPQTIAADTQLDVPIATGVSLIVSSGGIFKDSAGTYGVQSPSAYAGAWSTGFWVKNYSSSQELDYWYKNDEANSKTIVYDVWVTYKK